MEKKDLILGVIVVLVIIMISVIITAFSGNNTFQNGQISFEYPKDWSQDHIVGNFSNNSLYSEVTFKKNFPSGNGTDETAYIILQKEQKAIGTFNLPTKSNIAMNTSSPSTVSVGVANLTHIQIASYGKNVAHKTTIMENNEFYIYLEYISPPWAVNATEEAYNTILKTLKIS
ncbi:MAG: hypothetical protein HVN35_01750 [Methanobacteriaceae archaeon]|nr:hypothetical protein [Methanobacteriaceae archaeon]